MLKNIFKSTIFIIFLLYFNFTYAEINTTKRIPELSNEKVNVWKTIIYPTYKAKLKMHRHDYDRIVVALTNGILKVTNNQGKIHYLKLKKGKSYYLHKDPTDELHTDENTTNHPIAVVVIELKN